MGKNKGDVNADSMQAFISSQVETAKGQRKSEKKDPKGERKKSPLVDDREPKRQKSGGSSKNDPKQTTLTESSSRAQKKPQDSVPPPKYQTPGAFDNQVAAASPVPQSSRDAVPGSATGALHSVFDTKFNGLHFMERNFNTQIPHEMASQGVRGAVTLAVNQALAAASCTAGLLHHLKNIESEKTRANLKLEETRAAYSKLKSKTDTAAKRAETAKKQTEDALAGVRRQLQGATEGLAKERAAKAGLETKLTAAEEKIRKLEAELKKADETLLEKSSRQSVLGHLSAKDQLQILYPKLDFSEFGFMKKIVDGKIVGPADPEVSSLPFMQESDGEDEDEGVGKAASNEKIQGAGVDNAGPTTNTNDQAKDN